MVANNPNARPVTPATEPAVQDQTGVPAVEVTEEQAALAFGGEPVTVSPVPAPAPVVSAPVAANQPVGPNPDRIQLLKNRTWGPSEEPAAKE